MQNGIFLFLIKNKVSKKRSILDPLQDQKKLADPDPITCDPGSRVHDPDPEAVIPDPIYLVTTLIIANYTEKYLLVSVFTKKTDAQLTLL